jgi:hypothetical protein
LQKRVADDSLAHDLCLSKSCLNSFLFLNSKIDTLLVSVVSALVDGRQQIFVDSKVSRLFVPKFLHGFMYFH